MLSTCSWVRIPLGPTFYIEWGNLGFLEDVTITLINKPDPSDTKTKEKLLDENSKNFGTRLT